jgi:hypothetical protein
MARDCFMKLALSQNKYSSSITPFFQRPTVDIGSLKLPPVMDIEIERIEFLQMRFAVIHAA